MQESQNGQNNCILYMRPASCSTNTSQFYYSDINLFLTDDTWRKLCNKWLLLCDITAGVSLNCSLTLEEIIVVVITILKAG